MLIRYATNKRRNAKGHLKTTGDYFGYPPQTLEWSKRPIATVGGDFFRSELAKAIVDDRFKMVVVGYSQNEHFGIEDVMRPLVRDGRFMVVVTFEQQGASLNFAKLDRSETDTLDDPRRCMLIDDVRQRYVGPTEPLALGSSKIDLNLESYDDKLFVIFDCDALLLQHIMMRAGENTKLIGIYNADDERHSSRFINLARWLGEREDFLAIAPEFRRAGLANELRYFVDK